MSWPITYVIMSSFFLSILLIDMRNCVILDILTIKPIIFSKMKNRGGFIVCDMCKAFHVHLVALSIPHPCDTKNQTKVFISLSIMTQKQNAKCDPQTFLPLHLVSNIAIAIPQECFLK